VQGMKSIEHVPCYAKRTQNLKYIAYGYGVQDAHARVCTCVLLHGWHVQCCVRYTCLWNAMECNILDVSDVVPGCIVVCTMHACIENMVTQ